MLAVAINQRRDGNPAENVEPSPDQREILLGKMRWTREFYLLARPSDNAPARPA